MAYTTIDLPTDYFNTKIWTGDGNSTQAISGIGHQPDLVWIKNRNLSSGPNLFFDSVRGTNKALVANNANAEASVSGYLNSFDSDGFTVGNDGAVNGSGDTYVSWNWKAGGSASSNSDGSITSSVSANTTAGFSIATFTTSSGSSDTIGHGLGVAPSVVICKATSASDDWFVFHESLGATKRTRLNLTNVTDTNTIWNDTAPTSSVFSLRLTNFGTSRSGVAYCFAEKKGFSKFGSYSSINSHDSNFVYLGFKPAMIIFKNTSYSGGSDWNILDRTRYTFNSSSEAVLEPNTNDAENYSAFGEVDFLSNGFKIRNNNGVSSGGYDHIYMAFAEAPFVSSKGIPTTAR